MRRKRLHRPSTRKVDTYRVAFAVEDLPKRGEWWVKQKVTWQLAVQINVVDVDAVNIETYGQRNLQKTINNTKLKNK